jgi:hypothetical protein
MGGFYNPYARSVTSDAALLKPQPAANATPRAENGAVNPFARSAGK